MDDFGATTSDIIEPMKEWLTTCDSRHAGTCVEPTTSSTPLSTRPDRLIDVENQCIVRGSVQGHYLALSYIWQNGTMRDDGGQQFQLSRDNVDFLAAPDSLRQHVSQLPKTIRDAMELTTALQIKYLWVDRLCIVQDDPHKEEELLRMDQIYSGAYMTIIAAAEHGLYRTPDGTFRNPALLETPNDWLPSSEISDRIGYITECYGAVSLSKWAKRAWTYQEYILSKRVVFFLDTCIFWQCECAVWDMKYLGPKYDDEEKAGSVSVVSDVLGPVLRTLTVPTWPDFSLYADLICPYNGRDMSYSADGLAACSAILNRLAPAFPNGFIFGMPRIYLDHALLWQPLSAQYEISNCAVIADGIPGKTCLSERRHTLPSWAWCGWQCFVDPRSFQAALNMGRNGCDGGDSTSSWKLRSILTWEVGAAVVPEAVTLDETQPKPGHHTLSDSSFQGPSFNGSGPSARSHHHISAQAEHALFFPAATLEIRFQKGWSDGLCSAFFRAFADPVLSEKNLHAKPKVVVLRDAVRRFSGLLCITGSAECKQGAPMELVAISRGSARGSDLNDCYEERVFALSRYRDAKPFWPVHDDNERWVDVVFFTPEPGQCHDRVVATGDYETELEVEEDGYEKDQDYEFYNVLWVQRGGDGIMSRAGCGRVLSKHWEENSPTSKWITLG